MEWVELAQSILRGEWDVRLDQLRKVIEERERTLAIVETVNLRPGSRVIAKPNVRPFKLRNRQGTVVRVNRERIVVQFDGEPGRWRMQKGSIERLVD